MTTTEVGQSICNFWFSVSDVVSWEATKNFANSAFVTALLGSLAGAFAGAAAAQRIAERSKHREELLREMRNTNAAIALAFGVCNTLLALKKQHVKSLKERYDAQKAALLEFQRKRKAREIQQDVAFDFNADMQTLQPQALPMDTLRAVVFERLSIVGRPLNLVVTLTQTVESLAGSLAKRNSLIEGYKGGVRKRRATPCAAVLRSAIWRASREPRLSRDHRCHLRSNGRWNLLREPSRTYTIMASSCRMHSGRSSRMTRLASVRSASVQPLMPDETNYADWVKAFEKKT